MEKEHFCDGMGIYREKLQSMDKILHQISFMDRAEQEDDLGNIVPSLLQTIGEYTDADRVYIFEWSAEEKNCMSNTYEWCADGVNPEIDNLQAVPVSIMPSWMIRFEKQETVVIGDLENIKESTPEEYEFLKAQEIKSLIAVPLYTNKKMIGFMGLDNPDMETTEISITLLADVGGHLGCVRENLRNTKRLQDALEDAKKANLSKTTFLRRMSHDIRTPLNGIIGMLHIADSCGDDVDKLRECRQKVQQSTDYLLELVNNVLDISKMESGSLVLSEKPFDLISLLENQMAVISMNAYEHHVRLENGLDVCKITHRYLIGSPIHLNRVLMNLMSNAIKYNRRNGTVWTSCEEISSDEERAVFKFICADTGLGMSKEFQKHAFEPFAQEGKETITGYNGSGLGLSIVRDIVELMGGTITLESEENVGTTFTIVVPFMIDQSPNPEKELEEELEKVVLSGKKVLLVEDNALNMEIAHSMLEEEGLIVSEAKNGKEAVEAFACSAPDEYDFVVMDVMMPVMDGLEATRAIRQLERVDAKSVPIIAMTANAFEEDKKACLEAGMNEHIGKPINRGQLKKILASWSGNLKELL